MKIALYASLIFDNPIDNDLQYKGSGPTQHNLLGYVKCLNATFKSAKKYFLKNHDVEFILISNVDNIEEFGLDTNLVSVVKAEYDLLQRVREHALLTKVLCIEFLNTTKYDKIYFVDHDSLFINEIVDEDLLPYDMVAQRHWAKEDASYQRGWMNATRLIPIETIKFNPTTPGIEWIMGNFFGGNSNLMKDMAQQSKELHNTWVNVEYLPGWHFYALHPDELCIGKYMYENVQNYKLLDCIFDLEPDIDREWCNPPADGLFCLPGWGLYHRTDRTKQYWLSEFKKDETLYPNITLAKLLHGTKSNFELLDKVLPYYT